MHLEWLEFAGYLSVVAGLYYTGMAVVFYPFESRRVIASLSIPNRAHGAGSGINTVEVSAHSNPREAEEQYHRVTAFTTALPRLLDQCKAQGLDNKEMLMRIGNLLSIYRINLTDSLFDNVLTSIIETTELRIGVRFTPEEVKLLESHVGRTDEG